MINVISCLFKTSGTKTKGAIKEFLSQSKKSSNREGSAGINYTHPKLEQYRDGIDTMKR